MTNIKDYVCPFPASKNLFLVSAVSGFTVMLFLTPFLFALIISHLFSKNIAIPFTLALSNAAILLAVGGTFVFFYGKLSAGPVRLFGITPDFKFYRTLGVFVLMAFDMFLIIGLTSAWGRFFGYNPPEQGLVTFAKNAPFWLFAVLAFSAVVLAPVAEELLFRHVLFNLAVDSTGPFIAIFITSSLFALMHFNVLSFLSLFLMGIVLQTVYVKWGTLLAPILMHSAFNALNMILVAFVRSDA